MADPVDPQVTLDGAASKRRLDAADEARRGASLSLAFQSSDSERLDEICEGRPGPVSGDLRFELDALGRVLITGSLEASLSLRCERCLQPVALEVEAEVALQIVGQGAAEVEDGYELLETGPRGLIPMELVEEELILAMPLSPKHEDIAACGPEVQALMTEATDEVAEADEDEGRVSPFAVLETLRKKH